MQIWWIRPVVGASTGWIMDKMGQPVDPLAENRKLCIKMAPKSEFKMPWLPTKTRLESSI